MCGCGCAWVILNKVKNLVISVIASALTLSDPSTALRYAQDDKQPSTFVGRFLPTRIVGERVVVGRDGKRAVWSVRVLKIIPVLGWDAVAWA